MTLTELIAQEKAAQPKAAPKTLTLSELIAKEKVAQQGTTPQVPPGDYASMGPLGKILDVAGREGYAATNVVSKFYEGGSILDVPKNYMAGITAESRKTILEIKKEVQKKISVKKVKTKKKLKKQKNEKPPLEPKAETKKEEKTIVRKNGLSLKKEIEDEEAALLAKEKIWETPAFLRKKLIKGQ